MDFLVSALEMAELDRQATEHLGVPSRVLMELAGHAVAKAAADGLAPGARVCVACGPGNNGGDGFVAARWLAEWGFAVEVFVVAERQRIGGDARAVLAALEKAALARVAFLADARGVWELASAARAAALVIDALLGTGARGAPRSLIASAIDALNDARRPILAVDIPSGVDADTGVMAGTAVRATRTVTFAFAKRGHYSFPGGGARGELSVVDIGIPARLAEKLGVVGRLVTPRDGPSLWPARAADSHKGTYGKVLVVAGSPAMPGAALLALQGALRGGPGLVSWLTDRQTLEHARQLPPEVLLELYDGVPSDEQLEAALLGVRAVVIGPGYSRAPQRAELLRALLRRCAVPMCLDADALNLLAANPELWELSRAPLVLTPHPGELARLAASSVEEIARDRFAAAMGLALARRCVVVLKGAATLVADVDGTVSLIAAGNAGMASGGTGDVLAGVVGALLAQGRDPGEAARGAALAHACAGDAAAERFGQAGLVASDVALALGDVLAAWRR